ncbi:MAG: PilZ domain-containing protein [Calditrichaceae bacterium]
MDSPAERRTLHRIEIPGTKVVYRKPGGIDLFNTYSKPVELINISKGGMCITVTESFDFGDSLAMKVYFPDGEKLKLKGQVRWQKPESSNGSYTVGIQFFAFGYQRKYNAVKSLDYLRTLKDQSVSAAKQQVNAEV